MTGQEAAEVKAAIDEQRELRDGWFEEAQRLRRELAAAQAREEHYHTELKGLQFLLDEFSPRFGVQLETILRAWANDENTEALDALLAEARQAGAAQMRNAGVGVVDNWLRTIKANDPCACAIRAILQVALEDIRALPLEEP